MATNFNPFAKPPEKTKEQLAELQQLQKEMMQDDLNYVEDCKAALIDEKLPWANSILYLFVILTISFFIWAAFAEIDKRTQGVGQVIPSKTVQLIQSLEGGLITEILVKEGDIVHPQDVLLRLDDTIFDSTYKESIAKYNALRAKIARLNAEVDDSPQIDFPPDLVTDYPVIVSREQELFQKKQNDFNKSTISLAENVNLLEQELKIKEPLVQEGVISLVELLAVKRLLLTAEEQLENLKSKYYKDALEELTKAKGELSGLEESIRGYQNRVDRTTIRSPVYGVVKNILLGTIGGVVRSGENIMEIVPLDDTLLIKAKIRPSDVGFIYPGQKAFVKFTAYDFSIYGGLEGVVENISADTIVDPVAKESFYEVKVRTFKNHIGKEWNPLPIIPGMVAEVSIITGKNTILRYLLKPIIKAKDNAFTER